MALDRQSIEKKDFPIGRRGYDPDAVDSHLSALADEIDELKRSARRRSESLAAAASEQVRSIVEAAETTAADIQRQAEDEARDIRAEASSEAESTREHATSEARDYVGKVSESTSGMLERIDAMENELNALIESLRTGSNRLTADLQLLEGNLAAVKNAVVPRPAVRARAGGRRVPSPPRRPPSAAAAADAPGELPEPAEPAEPFEQSVGVAGAAAGEVLTDAGPRIARRLRPQRRRGRERAADRSEHGDEPHAARRDRPLPGRELQADRPAGPARRGLLVVRELISVSRTDRLARGRTAGSEH